MNFTEILVVLSQANQIIASVLNGETEPSGNFPVIVKKNHKKYTIRVKLTANVEKVEDY